MLRILLFLGTNLAIVALISLTFRLLGLEGLLQSKEGPMSKRISRRTTLHTRATSTGTVHP